MRRFASGCRFTRPVERRIAAADDQDALVAEGLHLAHGVVHAGALIGVDALDRRLLRLERAAAGGDHDRLAFEDLVAVGPHPEARRLGGAERLQALDHLAEMEDRPERLDLAHQVVDDALAGDDRKAGDVVDRLLGIELGALPADFRQDVDEMGLDVEEAELEHREQPDRARADDHDIGLDALRHRMLLKGSRGLNHVCPCVATAPIAPRPPERGREAGGLRAAGSEGRLRVCRMPMRF